MFVSFFYFLFLFSGLKYLKFFKVFNNYQRYLESRRHLTDRICGIPSNRQLNDTKGNFSKQSVVRQ